MTRPLLWVFALALVVGSVGAQSNLTVDEPFSFSSLTFDLVVGDDAFLSWTGGEAPYDVKIVGNGKDVEVATGQQFTFYSWTVSLEPGNGYQLEITDAGGYAARSLEFAVVDAASASTTTGYGGFGFPTALSYPGIGTSTALMSETTRALGEVSRRASSAARSSASAASSAPAASASTQSTLSTGTKIGIAVGAVGLFLLSVALVGLLLWKRRKSHTDHGEASFVSSSSADLPGPSQPPTIAPFPYHSPSTAQAPAMSSAASASFITTHPTASLASAPPPPSHPGLTQQYSADSRSTYATQSSGALLVPSGASTAGDSASFMGTSTAAAAMNGSVHDCTHAKAHLAAASSAPPADHQPAVIQETDSGAAPDLDGDGPERLPPSYNQAWSRA